MHGFSKPDRAEHSVNGKHLLLSGLLLPLLCTSGFAITCPSGSTQLTSTSTGGNASNAQTWGGTSLGTGDGMCLIVQGPVVLDQDLGTSGGTGVYTIVQSGSGSLAVDSSASRHIYFASTGSDPIGSGSYSNPAADATMYGFFFPAGTLSLAGTQSNPVIINSAGGVFPWYVNGNVNGSNSFNLTVKWCDCYNLGTNSLLYEGFSALGNWNATLTGNLDVENSRFTSPYEVISVRNSTWSSSLTFVNNVVTGRRSGVATIDFVNLSLASGTVRNNTESAPATVGWFTSLAEVSGSSFTYTGNVVSGAPSVSIGNLAINGDLQGSGAIEDNLTYNDPAQAGALAASGMSLTQTSVFTGAIDSNYCENCNQAIAVRGIDTAASLTLSNNFSVTNHLAWEGQGIYFIQGGTATLTGNVGIFTDLTSAGSENCIFAYDTKTVLIATNNTCHSVAGPGTFSLGIVIGEPGYHVSSAAVDYNLVSGYQYGILDFDSGNQYFNLYAGAGVHQNDVWNSGTPYFSYGSPGFDNGSQPHPSAIYGDLTLDPGYLDPTRLSLANYDSQVLGGPGTAADVLGQLGYRSGWGGTYQLSANPVADALTWFRTGFTPANAGLCPGGVSTGAMPCADATLTFSPATLPAAAPGVNYSQTLTVNSGSNCTFSAVGALPPGLGLSFTGTSNVAFLAGVPSAPGLYSTVIEAICSDGSIATPATITVSSPPQQIDVTGQIHFTIPGLVTSRGSNIYRGSLTLSNTGATPIDAPIQMVFSNLVSGITLVNQTGTVPSGPYAGSPYITAAGNSPLAPGASIAIPIQLADPSRTPISYVPKTLSGGF